MGLSFRPMGRSEIDAFIVASTHQYVSQRVTSGEDEIAATRAAREQASSLFPGGAPAPGHLMFTLEDDGVGVGSLWIGPAEPGEPGPWWIWDIAIDEEHRGRGYGRAAMLRAEAEARAHGASELGLSVFGFNTVARRLYESLGYETIAVRMSKQL